MLGNVFTVLDRVAAGPRRDAVAVMFEGEVRTYLQLRERALRFATALAGAGVDPGDRVGVLLPNGLEWPEVFFGAAALGAICVPINVLNSGPEVMDVLEDCQAETLVVGPEGSAKVAEVAQLPERLIAVAGGQLPGALDYESLLAEGSPSLPQAPDPDDLFILYYSSGTTGRPKAAAHTHMGVLWNAYQQIADFSLTADDRYLAVSSMSWAAGFNNLILPLWWLGGSTVFMPTGGVTIDRIVTSIRDNRCTHTFLVPTLLKQLLDAPAQLGIVRDSGLRWVLSGAEPVPVTVIEQMNAELPGCSVVQGYGLSEFPTIAAILRPEEALSRAGSTGRPMSITQLAVRTQDGSIAPQGEGEVLLRSLASMREYYGKPEETDRAFRDGWLNTGDTGVVDEEGYLTITGRSKDMIISGGLNIYPKEIEEVIYRVDGVAEAAVVGVPDDRWGETVVAVVVHDGTGRVTERAVEEACQILGRYKQPRAIIIRAEPLPRSTTQKVLKREVRPWVELQLRNSRDVT